MAALNILIVLIGVLHIYFLVLEMFLWTKPKGLKTFRQSLDQAKATSTLAANQGLYNGFLAAGLFWSVVHSSLEFGWQLRAFFLGCVLIAGLYGGYSVGRRIAFIQALPAAIGLALLFLV